MSHHALDNQASSPLWAVVLCWTSISPEQRSEMVDIAAQMGASHKLDLTSDVTHLIVGNIDSAKYRYVAKERQDIKVLKPRWLDAVRESWMRGDNTDIAALEKEHQLATFSGLQICVTGFDDVVERQGLQDAVNHNGATYHGDLTKSVTHLVAAAPKGKKYEYARIWNIKVVSIEWIRDSLERAMALDESLYHPTISMEERGIGAVTRKEPPPQLVGKRQRQDAKSQDSVNAGRRKLRRTASSKLGSQSGDLWAEIGNDGQAMAPGIDPKRRSSPLEQKLAVRGVDAEPDERPLADEAPLVNDEHHETSVERHPNGLLDPGGTMSAKYFVLGFESSKKARLIKILNQNGALPLEEFQQRNSLEPLTLVLPHDASESVFADEGISDEDLAPGDMFVTDLWLEKCLYDKAYIDPEIHPLYKPFNARRIPEFESLTICPTSFGGADIRHISIAAQATGAVYNETLRKVTSVLVCNSEACVNIEKLKYALENGIPVVSQQWMWDSMKACKRLQYDDYTISGSRFSQTTNSTQPDFFHPINNPRARPVPSRTASRSEKHGGPRSQRLGQLFFSREVAREKVAPQRTESVETSTTVKPIPRPRPLQDMSPNLSPRKLSQPSQADKPPSPRPQQVTADARNEFAADDGCAPQESNQDDSMLTIDSDVHAHQPIQANSHQGTKDTVDSAIAALLAHKRRTTSRPSSASSDVKAADIPRQHRPLGRAASNGSTSFSRQNSTEQRSFAVPTTRRIGPFEDEASSDVEAEREVYQPSQVLGYEDPESAAHRERVFGHDGTTDDNDGGKGRMKRVESIGRVTDASRDPLEEKQKRRATRRKVAAEQ